MLNIKLHLPFVLVSLFDSSFTFTPNSICPLGDFSPSPTQQMVKVEHLTGLCCTCLEDEDHILSYFVPVFLHLVFLMLCHRFQDTFKDASNYQKQRKQLDWQILQASTLHFTLCATGPVLFIQRKQS